MSKKWEVDYVQYQEKFNWLAQPLEWDKTIIHWDYRMLSRVIWEDKEKIFQIFENNNPQKTPKRIEWDYNSVLKSLEKELPSEVKNTLNTIWKYIDDILNNPDFVFPKKIKPINYWINPWTIHHSSIQITPEQEQKFIERMNIAQYNIDKKND